MVSNGSTSSGYRSVKLCWILTPVLVVLTLVSSWWNTEQMVVYHINNLYGKDFPASPTMYRNQDEAAVHNVKNSLQTLEGEYKTVVAHLKETLSTLQEQWNAPKIDNALGHLRESLQEMGERYQKSVRDVQSTPQALGAMRPQSTQITEFEEKKAVEELLQEVEKNVEAKYKKKCKDIINGTDSMAQAHQDWILFHNYFKSKKWGAGFYLDLGANNPFDISNTLFFDKCLGWKGLCVEPNPLYHPLYKDRTCTLIKNCLYKEEMDLKLTLQGVFGQLLKPGEQTKAETVSVKCRTLDSILDEANVKSVDFASLDIEGQEAAMFQCFPFDDYNIHLWIIETNKQSKYLDYIMNRGGYNTVSQILQYSDKEGSTCGAELDTLYEKRQTKFRLPQPINPNYRFCSTEGTKLGERAPRCSKPGLPLSAILP